MERFVNVLLVLFFILCCLTVALELYCYAIGEIGFWDCQVTIVFFTWLAGMVLFAVWRARGW